MPQWTVQRGSSLEHFLRLQKVQQWKIAVLIDSGAVQVIRGTSAIPLKGPKTHVDQFDIVKLADPLSTTTEKALEQEAKTACRDYALAPGPSAYDKVMAAMLKARPETILIDDPSLADLAKFIPGLAASSLITNPIRHILVGSHASSEGTLKLRIGTIVDRSVNYSDLLDLIKSRALAIDIKALLPRPTDASNNKIQARFIIRGCRAGHQQKFVDKLRGALGGLVPVAAPLHYHLVTATKKPPGYVEYLGYAFELSNPTQFKNRAALITAMQGASFSRIDGNPLPAKVWDKWIPKNPHKLDRGKNEGEQRAVSFAKSPIDRTKLRLPQVYRYKIRKLFSNDNKVSVPGNSTKLDDRVKAVRDQLVQMDWFEDKTDFPVYARFGYGTIEEFIKAWEWRFKPKSAAAEVTYNA